MSFSEAKNFFSERGRKSETYCYETLVGRSVKKCEENLNRAAEKPVSHATPTFVEAITSLSIQDAFSILEGADNLATVYLMKSTESDLRAAFQSEVDKATNEVGPTEYWEPLTSAYNSFFFSQRRKRSKY